MYDIKPRRPTLRARPAPPVLQSGLTALGARVFRFSDAESAAAQVFRLIEICLLSLACSLFVHSVSLRQYSTQSAPRLQIRRPTRPVALFLSSSDEYERSARRSAGILLTSRR